MGIAKLRIALLGVSHWHLPLYLSGIPEGTIVAITDESELIGGELATRYGCPYYKDYRQMIMEKKPDFVFAFAPHYRMKEIADYLLDAGIGFTMEKPCGLNKAEVDAIYEKSIQKNGFCAIPFVWRYSDTVQKLKEKFLSSNIVHMSYKFVAGPPSRYLKTSKWMLSREMAGGGCMTNLGVHFIDMALYLTDSEDADTLSSIYQYGSEYDIETYASSMLRMSSGASLLLETGYAYPMSGGLQRENRWTIVTEHGYNILAENNLELRRFGQEPKNIPLNTDSDVYYPIFANTSLHDFVNEDRPRASLKEMVTVRKILDEMDRKAEGK